MLIGARTGAWSGGGSPAPVPSEFNYIGIYVNGIYGIGSNADTYEFGGMTLNGSTSTLSTRVEFCGFCNFDGETPALDKSGEAGWRTGKATDVHQPSMVVKYTSAYANVIQFSGASQHIKPPSRPYLLPFYITNKEGLEWNTLQVYASRWGDAATVSRRPKEFHVVGSVDGVKWYSLFDKVTSSSDNINYAVQYDGPVRLTGVVFDDLSDYVKIQTEKDIVPYSVTDGASYVMTDLLVTANMKIEVGFSKIEDISENAALLGACSSTNNFIMWGGATYSSFALASGSSGSGKRFYMSVAGRGYYPSGAAESFGKGEYVITLPKTPTSATSTISVIVNGVTKTVGYDSASTARGYKNVPISIFGLNNGTSVNFLSTTNMKFGYMKVWNGDNLIRDFRNVMTNGEVRIMDVFNNVWYATVGNLYVG